MCACASADEQRRILDTLVLEEGGLLSKASVGLLSLWGGASKKK